MAGTGIVWEGVATLIERLQKLEVEADVKLGSALYQEAQVILKETLPITPIQYGNLRTSGHVDPPATTGATTTVVIGFGGAAAPYALYVHERLDLAHKPPTQAKFLETVVNLHAVDFGERMASRMTLQL